MFHLEPSPSPLRIILYRGFITSFYRNLSCNPFIRKWRLFKKVFNKNLKYEKYEINLILWFSIFGRYSS
jgi:hypothetical protein